MERRAASHIYQGALSRSWQSLWTARNYALEMGMEAEGEELLEALNRVGLLQQKAAERKRVRRRGAGDPYEVPF